jgi:pyrimidine-nucleoside phosphorylase
MVMTELIARKKAGKQLTNEEIAWWIDGYVRGAIPDYQVSALLMAICFTGMSAAETLALTLAMVRSGEVADLSSISGFKVDKHSTGGVSDATTLVVGPVVAACGVKVAKMSGRGLGHTGGTVDKLESIPGLDVALSPGRMAEIVNQVGVAITGQSGNFVPADKALYALRDVTATVDSIPLIASSVMSKKIASGADGIVLDVKTGSGAFMRTAEDAFVLAKEMVDIGTGAGRKTVALVTDMDQPLGMAVGNSIEVQECIEVLKGEAGGSLREVSLLLATEMLLLGGFPNRETARRAAEEALGSRRALECFRRMIEAQGGTPAVVDDYSLLPQAKRKLPLISAQAGFVSEFDTEAVGRSAAYLGAGRLTKADTIDLAAGIVLKKRAGDPVREGETIAILHTGDRSNIPAAEEVLRGAIRIGAKPPSPKPLVFGRVTSAGTDRSPKLA